MSTILQIPDTYNLLGNLRDVKIASNVSVSLTLKLGVDIISKTEHHPIDDMVTVDLKKMISSVILSDIPLFSERVKEYNLSQFTLVIDAIPEVSFSVINGGVDADISATEFLQSNFLTWRPQTSYVRWLQYMTLSYVATQADNKVKLKGYFADGTDAVVDFCTLTVNKVNVLNLQYSTLPTLFANKQPQYVDAWVESSGGEKLTYTQRFVLSSNTCFDDVFIFQNSLGGWDSIILSGEISQVGASSGSTYEREDAIGEFDCKLQEKYKKNTGYFIDVSHEKWATELFRSSTKYWVDSLGVVKSIIIDATTLSLTKYKASAIPFTFYPSKNSKYINIARGEEPQEPIELVDPSGELFFLAPRLSEFQSATLVEELLFLVQSPHKEQWGKLSWGAIRSELNDLVLDNIKPFVHIHSNKHVLDRLGITLSGLLTIDDNIISSGGGDISSLGLLEITMGGGIASSKHDFAVADGKKLYIPSSAGNTVYDICIDDTRVISAEDPILGEDFVKTTGDIMSNQLTIEATAGNNYNEGIRINERNGWATIVLGDARGSRDGITGNAWGIFRNSGNSFNISPATSTSSAGLELIKNGDMNWRGHTVYHSGNLDPSGSINPELILSRPNASSYYQAYDWLQLNGGYGLYCPTINNAYFYPNTVSSFGTWAIHGNKNTYYGIHLGSSTSFMTLMDNGNDKGLYQESDGKWIFYFSKSTQQAIVDYSMSVSHYSKSWSLKLRANSYSWNYIRFENNTSIWDIGIATYANSGVEANSMWLARENGNNTGLAVRYGTSSYGKLVVCVPTGECTIGYSTGANIAWTVGQKGGIGLNFGWHTSRFGWVMTLSEGGHLLITGGLVQYSDERLKTNIKTLTGIEALSRLNPVEFKWNNTLKCKEGMYDHSFIAQEFQKLFPHAVMLSADGYLTIDKSVVIPSLVAGWQNHEKRLTKVEKLENRIKSLEKKY